VIEDYQSQTHVKWESKYHGAVVPNYHRKALYGKLRRRVGEILRHLCRQKGRLEESKAMTEHIHMLLSVLPKYSIAMTIGYPKAKSALRIHHQVLRARGYFVSTAGINQGQIRNYNKEQEDSQKSQLELGFYPSL